MKRTFVFPALLAALLFACATQPAPLPTAHPNSISGIVIDSAGMPLPGVTVTLASGNTPRQAVTDANGRYAFNGVPPGTYRVRVQLAGFNSTEHAGVTVTSARGAALQSVLTISAVSETITVTASAPSFRTMRTVATRIADVVPEPQYRHEPDSAFVDTRKDRTTTFAIDVDRASYANVRRMLTHGAVPPPDAVRIEEMVNYFTWSYPQPDGNAPFSITTEVAGCPWNAKNRLLRVGIQGRALEQWKMAPNNLVFLLDVSGSMAPPERLPLIRSAFEVLVNELRAEDRVAIVVYAGAAGLVLPSTSGADKETILRALGNLQAGGSTAGGEGIELAYKVARENFLPDGNNRVILATDGDFNVGVYGASALEKLIEKKRDSDIYLSILGVGDDNYQDAAMETLADKGNGNFAYLDSLDEAKKVFRRELTGTLVTIARDVKVQIEFDPARVASYRQIGYENRALANEDFDDDRKDAGELGAGHSVTALFEIVPASGGAGPIGSVRLRYKEPRGTRSIPLRADIVDEGRGAYDASPDMQFAAAVAQFGMLLRNSPYKGDASWEDVLHLANIARGADLDREREEFATLALAASRLSSK
ncbi:MAG: von Willebrand factor type A domain-containing protein [Acidobacteriota bacterium]|nr:von Willebrand factor type A domain-containing protein [Acidobacteriota bacterium]